MRTSDLIDRQALKDKLKRWDERDPYEFVEIALHAVDDAPTIDAVPMVRCRECRLVHICRIGQHLGLDGFCSKGEREVQDG